MNLFNNAKPVDAPKTPAKKADKAEVHLDNLQQLAELDALIKALSAVKANLDASVKAEAFNHFFNEAQAHAKRPDSFRGVDGTASASIEMRKRSTASALSEAEVTMLENGDLKVEKVIATQKLFGINPNYASDNNLLAKVSAALDGIVPADFIVVQEEKSKFVVGEATIEKAFAIKAPRGIIETLTVMAIKPKLETTDIGVIMENIRTLVL